MLKFITFRILRWRLKTTLPKVSSKFYNKLFNLSYNIFLFLKPSQLWVIILALLNKTEFSTLVGLPSMFILFSSIFSDSDSVDSKIDSKTLNAKLIAHRFTDPDNNWDNFFWILIVLALIKRFFIFLFKLLWIPFKIAFIYYILKYLGFDFTNLFNILNNLSLGIIDWFFNKITHFLNYFFNRNDKNS